MDKGSIETAARILLEARQNHSHAALLPDSCRPSNSAEAYEIQDHLSQTLGSAVIGWKVGATNAKAQETLSTDAPFSGRMLDSITFDSPVSLKFNDFFSPGIEVEMAFRLGKNLSSGKSYSLDDVRESVESMYGAIEVIDSRYEVGLKAGVPHNIADNGAHGAFVLGRKIENWDTIDRLSIPVKLLINGEEFSAGVSSNATGADPLESVVWLANDLSARGISLVEGEIITTGSCCAAVAWPSQGDSIKAEVGSSGTVEIKFD